MQIDDIPFPMTSILVTFFFLGTINGINLTQFYTQRILKHTTETLYKDVTITGDVIVDGNVLVSGFVNGLDLSEFTGQS